jgi:aspartyl-tRNA(Asn)/glutamyl-tRNA(Gln) amidotransferase subunit A
MAGNTAMSLPAGLAESDGLPVGLQIMAPALGEAVMYRVAAAFEASRDADEGGPLIQRVNGLEATV